MMFVVAFPYMFRGYILIKKKMAMKNTQLLNVNSN